MQGNETLDIGGLLQKFWEIELECQGKTNTSGMTGKRYQ